MSTTCSVRRVRGTALVTLGLSRIAAMAMLLQLLATTTAVLAEFAMDKTKSTSGSACAVANNRLYAFGGYLATVGDTKPSMTNGIYSIDLSQPFSTKDPPIASHGVIDPAVTGLIDMNAVVLGDGKIMVASGGTTKDINNATYIFSPSDNSVTAGPEIKTNRFRKASSMGNAATASDKYSAVPIYGGIQTDNSHATNMVLVSPKTTSVSTAQPADMVAREFASVMRFNSSQLLVSGGFGDDYQADAWLFNEASQSWTKAKWTMTMGRYFHRSVLYGSKPHLITVGGYSRFTPYTLVETVDLSANAPTSSAGTVVNADAGPRTLTSVCMTLVGDTLVLVGGIRTNVAGTNVGSALPTVSLLKIESANNGLQFRWVTDFKPASGFSSTKSGSNNGSGSNSSSNGGSDSTTPLASDTSSGTGSSSTDSSSAGLSTGAIVGIAVGAAAVGAVAVFGVLHFRQRRQIPTRNADVQKPIHPTPTSTAEPVVAQATYAQPQLYVPPQPTYAPPQPMSAQPQPTWAHQQAPLNTPPFPSATTIPPTPNTPTLSELPTLVSSTSVGYLMDPDTMQRPPSSVSGVGPFATSGSGARRV
ncbi:hypothetical protein AMAG_15222 [Allomyces macrogynus ATCC 38327]|uniref:Kelch repeat protein n=1 Tax=Allomyces macrogynus (strain ATCC 38327) TaxID=578462 RepID=A0A0L0T853_ALLM3|nr:hypothetical protein AMAG_15222 [Allomyces macrogynus ATCC 38327]|eukprot:KNE70958.1 hypothetical protein AMAG_15222 [Allomyces macrogynus ATCC 38327]